VHAGLQRCNCGGVERGVLSRTSEWRMVQRRR
jgi:hypothetical protein